MAMHMSLRLAWHSDGWNGHICKNPCSNTYCVGQYSYPGTLIAENRDLDYETKHAGEACSSHPCKAACGCSVNAFGKDTIQIQIDPPSWWGKGDANPALLTLPPSTACTWCYESMYSDDVLNKSGTAQKYDYEERSRKAEQYFAQFEEGKSLVFYYAGYSNPFSENEENNYVVAGISRLKKMGDFHYYQNISEEIRKKYAGGIVWQKPVTSAYPDEGFCIPYWKYMDNEDVLERLVIKPLHRAPFKYGSREITDDDAIEIVNQLVNAVEVLIEIGDTTENWKLRRDWLGSVLNELWIARGPYPGFASVLENLGLGSIEAAYLRLTNESDMKAFRDQVCDLLAGERDDVWGQAISAAELKKIRREYKLREEPEQKLLLDILPRFALTAGQMQAILSEDRENVSITASLDEILADPYIIFEQYQGYDVDDVIPFYKIDNGILASPDFGLDNLLDEGSTERLRAFCVDELNRIAAHSFGKAAAILESVNHRLDRMPEWKRYTYKLKNFDIETEVLEEALYLRRDENNTLYLYLRSVYEDERCIEDAFKALTDRPDIVLKRAISAEKFKERLKKKDSKLISKAGRQYEAILDKQAEICMKIFTKPLCVLSGAAGTGKTTVIRAIVENIKRVHGESTGFLLMAPTGKAAERIKTQTGERSTTIHSFLASNGWINNNFTLKRSGGKLSQDVNTIIVDECSMIDLNLFATLLRAINWNSVQRLILIGDPNQLPPIGRGRVFADTIAWLKAEYPENVGVLTDNIRQLVNRVDGNGNGILELANIFIQEQQTSDENPETTDALKQAKEEIFEKIQLDGNGDIDKDLGVYFWHDQEELQRVLQETMVRDMEGYTGWYLQDEGMSLNKLWTQALKKEDGSANPEELQIISPYRGEFYGTDALNQWMQSVFNTYWSRKYNLDGVSPFDKVIQFRNRPRSDMAYVYNDDTKQNERAEVFNGEIGIAVIHGLDYPNQWYKRMSQLEHIQVRFSNQNRRKLRYNYGKKLGKDEKGRWIPEQKVQENLELAYAISVHKSQGSEFDYVYIVIPKRDSHLLSMELLYTAITRAQKHVTIFLQDDIGTLTNLGHLEKSAVRRINSSIFEFKPLPEELLYTHNWHADEKKLATLSEYFVRSKSEVIIANMLVDRDIPFKYEEPLYAADGTMYLPDFTVTFRGETYYWEHVGMLDRPDYKAHWEKKQKWYEKNFPGQLLVTYEGKNLSQDALEIITTHS